MIEAAERGSVVKLLEGSALAVSRSSDSVGRVAGSEL